MPQSFRTFPEKLSVLLESINRGNTALPEFQRSFIWDTSATAKLLASLANDYPAGSLLMWKPKCDTLQIRPFHGASSTPTNDPNLILDGQQRLTALYGAIYGVGDYQFFFDLNRLYLGQVFDEEVVIALDARQLAKAGLHEPESQYRQRAFPVSDLRSGLPGFESWAKSARRWLATQGENANQVEDELDEIKNRWFKFVADYEFPVVQLAEDTPLEAVCRIFETVNSTGVKLGTFELLTARYWPQGVRLRDLWEEAQENDRNIERFGIDPYYVLQIVSLISYDVPLCTPKSVIELDASTVQQRWPDAIRGLSRALDLLRNEFGVVGRGWVPYEPMILPLAALLAVYKPAPDASEAARLKKIEQWYWRSVFSQHYEQGANSKAAADFADLRRWLAGASCKAPDAVDSWQGFDTNVLLSVGPRQKALYRGCIGLIVSNRPDDLHSGQKIQPNGNQREGMSSAGDLLDAHHVFPQALLANSVPRTKRDCVLNRTLVWGRTNRSIGKRRPSEYFRSIREAMGTDFIDAMGRHLLPADPTSAIWRDDFDSFIEQRRGQFRARIAAVTGSHLEQIT